jgi:SAM-dependent methyltransferase
MDKYEPQFYPEISFGGYTRFDGTIEFYTRVRALLSADSVVADVGCGRGEHQDDSLPLRRNLRCLKGSVARVVGLDVAGAGQDNATLDEFRQLTPNKPWPLADRSINLVLCDSVIEHLPDPDVLFREAQRVLVPRGHLCIRTTNLFSYVGLAARLMPNRYHAPILSRVQSERKEDDVFPTLYRCNTLRAIRRQFRKHHFHAVVYGHDAGPGYLVFSRIAYAAGFLHQRIAPGVIRPTIMGFGQLMES